ncbi:hypothetical protein VPH35_124894 [Triticum aestivum]
MDGASEGREQPMLEKELISSHKEHHFTAEEVVRDVIMGVSDGLTVPFALAAGLSGASAPSSLVLTAGLAEVAAGAISMGPGAAEVGEIMSQYGLEPQEYGPVVMGLRRNPQAWLEFMMRSRYPRRALQSALTIALSYVVGGLVPLMPYMLIPTAHDAMLTSVVVTLVALFFFGYVKGRFTGSRPLFSALQTTFIGAIASAAAYGIAKVVQA